MRPSERALYLLLFGALIAGPGLAYLAGWREPPIERRPPTPPPVASWQALADPAASGGELRAWWREQMPGRAALVALDAHVHLEALRVSPRPDEVALGPGGWLFYRPAWTAPWLAFPPELAVARLQAIDELLRASGREFVVQVVPSKVAIYPEQAGPWPELERPRAVRRRLRRSLQVAQLPGWQDLWAELERRKAEGRPLYFERDTHWRDVGPPLLARPLVERLTPGSWREEHLRAGPPFELDQDLAALIGLRQPVRDTHWRIERPGVELRFADALPGAPAGVGSQVTSASDGAPLAERRVLWLRDSQGRRSEELLAGYLREVWVVDHSRLVPERDHGWLVERALAADAVGLAVAEASVQVRLAVTLRGFGGRLAAALLERRELTVRRVGPLRPQAIGPGSWRLGEVPGGEVWRWLEVHLDAPAGGLLRLDPPLEDHPLLALPAGVTQQLRVAPGVSRQLIGVSGLGPLLPRMQLRLPPGARLLGARLLTLRAPD